MLTVNLDTKNSIAVLEPHGALREEDFTAASKKIDGYLGENGTLDGLIIYTKDFPGWDSFSSLISHLKFVNEHQKKISFLAFVTDSVVGEFGKLIAEHFVHPEVKNFDFDEFDKAKQWIIDSKENTLRHGMSMKVQRINNDFLLSFVAVGKLTHEDYEMITPVINSALEGVKEPNLNVYADISQLDGWELRAAWDDFKIGLKYGFDFNKIAIYGDQSWLKYGVKISSWFTSGEIKQFNSKQEALEWIEE